LNQLHATTQRDVAEALDLRSLQAKEPTKMAKVNQHRISKSSGTKRSTAAKQAPATTTTQSNCEPHGARSSRTKPPPTAQDRAEAPPSWLFLTRAEAARYVGVSSEAAIRAAEEKGLESISDAHNQYWLAPATLDAWPWRGPRPTSAEKARVLREAIKARKQEARAREREEEADRQREELEWETQLKRYDAEADLRTAVQRKARDLRAAFEHDHMDERTAAQALGFHSCERSKVRDLVSRGLLGKSRALPSPRWKCRSMGSQA
jgi:hypothetical protein